MAIKFGTATVANKSDISGADIQPQFVNRFQVVAGGDYVRIIFGDAVVGIDATYHSAIVMAVSDARELAELLQRIIDKQPDPVAKN